MPLAKVDVTVERDIGDRFNIKGYPTLKYFKNGKDTEFDGGRTAQSIVDWVESKMRPAVTTLTSDSELKEFMAEKQVVFVMKGADIKTLESYTEIADDNRDTGYFVFMEGSKETSVSVHHQDEGETTDNKIDSESILSFVSKQSFPLFGPINGENFQRISSSGKELVWVCMTPDDYKKNGTAVRDAAKGLNEKFIFVWLDTDMFGSHAESALGLSEYPGMVVKIGNSRYVYDKADYESKSISTFIKDVQSGKVVRSIKSEPIPTEPTNPAVLVGNNFEDVVLKSGKDVFLKVYAPWCGHCKRMAPVWDELAKEMEEVQPGLIVAKMDGTANETPVDNFDASGYPSLFFIRADDVKLAKERGDSYTPMKYDGAREKDDFIQFASLKASVGLGPVIKKEKTNKEEEHGGEL
eukprot:GHVR01030289.1.p1 GENE.GHVR01030289.1~~GHVR01030289.1.p1  ORF type:complete len:409 (+),score=104.14 GHVR01030289.1:245-1471(+)